MAYCPFCASINATFAEQINKHEITVVAKLVAVPPKTDELETEFPKAKFQIMQVLKGDEHVAPGMVFQTQLVGTYPLEEKFLVMGVEPPQVFWSTPMKVSERVIRYLTAIQALPESGPDRLAFFQDYFEDEDSTLAFDAYDEFAIADYADLIKMKDRIKKDRLIAWVQDSELRVDRRRLYFTMLGVCGDEKVVAMLEDFIKSDDPQKRAGLDALVASYLTLTGEKGLPLIEDRFLRRPDAEDPDVNAVISALRFHGTDVKHIPRERVAQSVRLALDHPKLADTVIPDLARWEDWSVIDRMVELFKNCDEDNQYVRVPVVAYLTACPKPEAKAYLKELEQIDPDAVRRARFFMGDYGDEDELSEEQRETSDEDKNPKASDHESESASGSSEKELTSLHTYSAQVGRDALQDLYVTSSANFHASTGAPRELDGEGKAQNALPPADSAAQPRTPAPDYFAGRDELHDKTPAPMPVSNQKTETASLPANRDAANPVSSNETASTATEAPAVAMIGGRNISWLIIFVPVGFSLLFFLLIWSIVNGWFERLIF